MKAGFFWYIDNKVFSYLSFLVKAISQILNFWKLIRYFKQTKLNKNIKLLD